MKIIAFGASNSRVSINKEWATYTANQFDGEKEILDLNDYEVEIFSNERASTTGIPLKIKKFDQKIQEADLIIISFAEYNGSYAAAFKNIFDWHSKLVINMFKNKKLILLATSPGKRGGIEVLNAALNRFPHHGATILGSFSLPSFQENFKDKALTNLTQKNEFQDFISSIKEKMA